MLIGIDGNEANVKERVGSNVYAFELIRAIERQDRENEYLIYLREKKSADLPQNREKFGYRVIYPKFLWTQWRLPLDLYFHQPRPNVFFTPGHYAPRFSPIPRVISILDLSFLKYPQSFKPTVLQQLKGWTYQSAKNAAHILTISQATKKDIIDAYDIPANKITVTYPGINQRFEKQISDRDMGNVKQKYNIPDRYLLALGTKQPKKNFPRLIQAFNSITNSLDNSLSLVIAGKTWAQFEPSSHSTIKPSNVIELGFIPDEDLPALYKGAETFVLVSLYEGFGIPVAEAMAVGTIVVASRVSSLPEVIGDAGILVDPFSIDDIAKGINLALNLSPEKRVQLIRKAQTRSHQFTWENCAKQTLEVLYEVTTKSLRSATKR